MFQSLQVALRSRARLPPCTKHLSRTCLSWLAGVCLYPVQASALGLGEISVHSALNQPFNADIVLLDSAALAEGSLPVGLASAAEFKLAGVERLRFLDDLRFTVFNEGGRSLIRVTSSQPVTEPLLDFLVQVEQPNGRLLREYTVLVDPPGSPEIVPQGQALPTSAASPIPAAQTQATQPAPVAMDRPQASSAEQLAAVLAQNSQLQQNLEALHARLEARDRQILTQQQQLEVLKGSLTKASSPVASPPVTVSPAAPVKSTPVPEDGVPDSWPIAGVLCLLLLGLLVRRRQRAADLPETARDAAYDAAPVQLPETSTEHSTPLSDGPGSASPVESPTPPQRPQAAIEWALNPGVPPAGNTPIAPAREAPGHSISWRLEDPAPTRNPARPPEVDGAAPEPAGFRTSAPD